MFTPQAMQHATLYVLTDDMPVVGLTLAEYEIFNVETESVDSAKELPGRPGEEYRAHVQQARTRLDKILSHFKLTPTPLSPERLGPVTQEALEQCDEELGRLWRDCSRWQEISRRVEQAGSRNDHLSRLLEQYQGLDIDLALLHDELRFLDVKTGAVARNEVTRLRRAVELAGYSLEVFLTTDDTAYVALAGLKNSGDKLRTVLEAAAFRPLEMPPEFRDRPSELRKKLDARGRRIETDKRRLLRRLEQARKRHLPFLEKAAHILSLATPCAELVEAARNRGALTRVSGWIPRDRGQALRKYLSARLGNRFSLQLRDPQPDEFRSVPSLVHHPQFLRPFSMLVRNYGVPRYGELDPTWLFAVTFVLMFGMMFGDVGHGLVIASAGLVFRKLLQRFARLFVIIGLASTVFGVLYGSVFGYETLIKPLWVSPMSDPVYLLKVAIYWGMGLILLATGLAIRNRWVEGNRDEALFGGEGIAGVVVYLASIVVVYRWLSTGVLGSWIWLAVAAPLLVMLSYQWRQAAGRTGERLLVVPILTLETLISYGANTLSFLRLAAFGLNHAALALAIYTIAQMTGPLAHWVIAVVGNIFILVLEGAIVAIQVLRLEYYENFSRFFSGDGTPFHPLRITVPVQEIQNRM